MRSVRSPSRCRRSSPRIRSTFASSHCVWPSQTAARIRRLAVSAASKCASASSKRPRSGAQPAERKRDRAVGVGISEHRVARCIGRKLPIENLSVCRVAEIGANVGEHEHGRQPVPVARHEAKLALGQALEFDPRLVRSSQLEQGSAAARIGRTRSRDSRATKLSKRRLEIAETAALPQDHAVLDEKRVERQRATALLPRRKCLLRQRLGLVEAPVHQRAHTLKQKPALVAVAKFRFGGQVFALLDVGADDVARLDQIRDPPVAGLERESRALRRARRAE